MFKPGDYVQAKRLYVKRQHGGRRPKTEETKGIFVRYNPAKFVQPKHPTCLVRWFTGEAMPPYYEQLVRIDYIEPWGTPR